MQQSDSGKALLEFAENASDEAFAALVKQHIDLVYSVALRHVGDPHQAEEITQAVFIVLAKKAKDLRHEKALSTWLFQTTRLIARNFVRSEMRRHHREQEAYRQSVLQESSGDIWSRIALAANALTKGAVVSCSTLSLVKRALKFMAWTKTKTAILLGAVAIVVTTSTVVGIRLAQDGIVFSGLSPTGMAQVYTIATDGSVRLQTTIEETNLTDRTMQGESIELRLDKVVPPGGKTPFRVAYWLPKAAR